MLDKKFWHDKNKKLERRILERYWYVEKCYGQAHAYFAEPKQLVMDFMLATVFLKQFGFDHWSWVLPAFGLGITIAIVFGHITLKRGWQDWFMSFTNQFNPEILEIQKNVKTKKLK